MHVGKIEAVYCKVPPYCRYLLAAISPAVLVPSLLLLQSKKPPTADDRGLPTMMIVSGALDDVVSIALFGVFLGLTFSSGTSLALSVLRGPIEILLGLVFGVLVGVILWYLPPSDAVSLRLSCTCTMHVQSNPSLTQH